VAQFVTQRPRARLDLLEQFVYFGEQSGVTLSERYFAAVEDTCSALSNHPLSGVQYDTAIPGLKGLRRFPVRDFGNYFLFYLPVEHGIDIVRVLHAARDIASIFELEEAP